MPNKDRRTEVYNISLIDKNTRNLIHEPFSLSDFLLSFFNEKKISISENDAILNIFKYNKNNLTYFFEDDVIIEEDIIKVKFSYIISNKKVDILNASTLKKTGEKEKSDGDLERQHILIKLFKDTSQALLIFEKIPSAINIGCIRDDFNIYLNDAFLNKYDSVNALIHIAPAPTEDFLEDLMNTKKISLVKLFVDRTKTITDPDLIIAGDSENVRDTAELTYKPTLKNIITREQAKGLYYSHKNKPAKIFRIVVEANGENGKIRLDTEGAKMSKYIKTNLSIDGLVDTEDIFVKFETFVNSLPQHLINICIEEVAATGGE